MEWNNLSSLQGRPIGKGIDMNEELEKINIKFKDDRVELIVNALICITQVQPQLKFIPSAGCHKNEIAIMLGEEIYQQIQDAIKLMNTKIEELM